MTLDEAKAILANPDSTPAQKKQAEIFIQQSGNVSQAPTPVKNTGINLDLSNEDHDIWARQMGAENWLDAIEKYKENPKWFTDNKYKVQGDERYTPEMIISRLESELSTQPGAKSAGGERSSATPMPNSESESAPRELTFDELATQLGLDPNNPTKEGQEKLRSWLEDHAGDYTSGEKTNAYLNAELQKANELAEPEKGDTKKEKAAKNQYKKSAMSIWDAYHNGLIDKGTAAYFTIDAIATLARNLGRSIGNVGAQFSGGTIDQGHDESMWEKRKGEMFGEETQLEKESLGGPAGRKAASEIEGITSQQLANARTSIQNEYTRTQLEQEIAAMEKQLEMAGINISNAESKKAVIDEIKKDKNWASNPLKVIAVSMLAESGTTGITNTAKGIFDSILGLAK